MTKKWLLCTVMLLPVLARAESIEEKRARATAESSVASSAKNANSSCKTNFPTSDIIDWSSWRSATDDKGHHASTLCSSVVSAVGSTCNDKISRDTVGRDIKRVICMGDAAGELYVGLKDGILYVHTNFGEQAPTSKTKAWLVKHLP